MRFTQKQIHLEQRKFTLKWIQVLTNLVKTSCYSSENIRCSVQISFCIKKLMKFEQKYSDNLY